MPATTGATRSPRLEWIEPVAVFVLIMLYIWWLRYSTPSFWIPLLGLVVLSHRWHGEDARSLGFRWTNFGKCASEMSPALILIALALLGTGMLLGSMRPISFDQGLLAFAAYCPWGLFQQYLLNGYFANRFSAAAQNRQVPALAAALFAGAHLPNWFLMGVTLAAGYFCTQIYLKLRNLYFLGLAHGTIGFLLYLVVPDTISHHLNVGPSFFLH
jgi:hypothetical protein